MIAREITAQRREATSLSNLLPPTNQQGDRSCDAQFTWESDRFVDFYISYGLLGIHLLIPENKKNRTFDYSSHLLPIKNIANNFPIGTVVQ